MISIQSSFFLFLCVCCCSWTLSTSFAPPRPLWATTSSPTRNTESSFCLYAKKKKKAPADPDKGKANHEKWQPFFDAMCKFKDENGQCLVITEEDNPTLFEWHQDQLKAYENYLKGRKTKMTKKRATALEQLGAIPPELMTMVM
jgi:hypothetical protein